MLVPFSDNKEEKSGNVSRMVRRNGSSDDIVRSTSTMLRNKENGRILLSCDSLCLKRVPQPRLVLIISCLLAPRCQDAPDALDSFFFREPPFSFVICSFILTLPLFRHMCFLLFYMYNYSSKCLYSVLYSSM